MDSFGKVAEVTAERKKEQTTIAFGLTVFVVVVVVVISDPMISYLFHPSMQFPRTCMETQSLFKICNMVLMLS